MTDKNNQQPGAAYWTEYYWNKDYPGGFFETEEAFKAAQKDPSIIPRALKLAFNWDAAFPFPDLKFRGTQEILQTFSAYYVAQQRWDEAVKIWLRAVQKRRSLTYVPAKSATEFDWDQTYRPNREKILAAYNELIQLVQHYDPNNKHLPRYLAERELVSVFKPIPSRYPQDKRKVDDEVFWDLIDSSWKSGAESTDEALLDLVDRLEVVGIPQIKRFHKLLLTKLEELHHWDVWGVGYLLRGGCSDDSFDYFKAWIIAQGRETFNAVVHNPEDWALQVIERVEEKEFQAEELLLAAEEALSRRGSEEELPALKEKKPKGSEWTEADLHVRYPRIAEKLKTVRKP